jgi:hypothetical protein
VGKPKGKSLLGRARCSWKDNIKTDLIEIGWGIIIIILLILIDLREIGWDGMDSIDLALDRDQWKALVNTVMYLRVPENLGKFFSS